MTEKLERLDVVYVFIFDEKRERILMVLNEKSWSLPGGKREAGETIQQAAIREVKEETGYEVIVEGVININERITNQHVLFITFRGRIIGGELMVGNDPEIQHVVWMPMSQAQQLMPWYGDLKELLTNHARYFAE